MVPRELRHTGSEDRTRHLGTRMTSTQTWILIGAVCVIALVNLIGLFRAT